MSLKAIVEALADLARAWLGRFVDVQGVDRTMALAAQAFSALIPLLIVYSALAPTSDGQSFSDSLINTFDLSGTAAASVRETFSSDQAVQNSVSIISVVLLLVSALSFSRGMQRLYELSFRLPSLGMRNTRWGLAWLGLLILYATIRPAIAGVFDGTLMHIVTSVAFGALCWTLSPALLLGRRVPWRRLLPTAALTSVGMTALTVSSVLWLPATISSSAEQFGVIGVAFALLSWLIGAAWVLVLAATGGAVLVEHRHHVGAVSPAPARQPPPARDPRTDPR